MRDLILYEPFFWSDEAVLFKLPYLTMVGYKNKAGKNKRDLSECGWTTQCLI